MKACIGPFVFIKLENNTDSHERQQPNLFYNWADTLLHISLKKSSTSKVLPMAANFSRESATLLKSSTGPGTSTWTALKFLHLTTSVVDNPETPPF